MSRSHRRRYAAAALAGLLLAPALAACDNGDITVPGSDLNSPSARSSSGTVSGSASDAPTYGPSGPPPHRISDDCTGAIKAGRASSAPRVFYAQRFSLEPGSQMDERRDATLYTYPPLSPGVLVLFPLREEPRSALEQAVLATLFDRGTTELEGTRELRWSVTNRTGRVARYLAWAGAIVTTTQWTRACGDGTHIGGIAIQVGGMRDGLARCGQHSDPAISGSQAAVEQRTVQVMAEKMACETDSYEAAPFRALPSRVQAGPN